MSMVPEIAALQHAHANCRIHGDALGEALADLHQSSLVAENLASLAKEDRRLLDQFAYRYTRLQDDMGARLMPAGLRALGEEISALPVLDRLNRLEQLGWLPSAEEWASLRRIRNEFAHDYPDTLAERFSRLQLAIISSHRLLEILDGISQKILQRFPDLQL